MEGYEPSPRLPERRSNLVPAIIGIALAIAVVAWLLWGGRL